MIIIFSLVAIYAAIGGFVGRYVYHHMQEHSPKTYDADSFFVSVLSGTFWPLAGPVFVGLLSATKAYKSGNKK